MSDSAAISTKKKIYDTFGDLLNTKDFKKIRVSEIIEIADINRSTFYAYFEDKHDLLQKYVKAEFMQFYLSDFNMSERDKEKRVKILSQMLELIHGHQEQLNMLSKRAGDKRIVEFFDMCADNVYNELVNKNVSCEKLSNEFCAKLIANGAVSTVKWWIFNDNKISAYEISNQIWEIYDFVYFNK